MKDVIFRNCMFPSFLKVMADKEEEFIRGGARQVVRLLTIIAKEKRKKKSPQAFMFMEQLFFIGLLITE